MGDEREIAASPAPSTNPSEAGSKSIEIVHYDILLSREKLESSIPPTPEPMPTEPIRPPSPYRNKVFKPIGGIPTPFVNQIPTSNRASPYRLNQQQPMSIPAQRGIPPPYNSVGSPPNPQGIDPSSRRQSATTVTLYSSHGSSTYSSDSTPRMTPQPSMEAYMAAAAKQAALYAAQRGPLEGGSSTLNTLQPEGPYEKDDSVIEEKRPMRLYKAVIGMIVVLILFAMYWIFVYPNLGFGTLAKKRVEVAENADMK